MSTAQATSNEATLRRFQDAISTGDIEFSSKTIDEIVEPEGLIANERRRIVQAPSEQMTVPALQALLQQGALAGAWVLDARRSSIRLKSKVVGLVRVNGVFHQAIGNGAIFPDGKVSGTLKVAAASIDTSNTRRDTHLRSADFFDSSNYPDITFTAETIRPSGRGVAVTGALTVRGRTRPLSFDAAASVRGDGEVWLDTEVHINRADFGLIWNRMGMVSMHTTLTIHAVFTRR
jgi:polyisoprenoid-binding protein YceI